MNRRNFLKSALILTAAPAIVRAESLMPVRAAVVFPETRLVFEIGRYNECRFIVSEYIPPYFGPDIPRLIDEPLVITPNNEEGAIAASMMTKMLRAQLT